MSHLAPSEPTPVAEEEARTETADKATADKAKCAEEPRKTAAAKVAEEETQAATDKVAEEEYPPPLPPASSAAPVRPDVQALPLPLSIPFPVSPARCHLIRTPFQVAFPALVAYRLFSRPCSPFKEGEQASAPAAAASRASATCASAAPPPGARPTAPSEHTA